jgi:hypothetical protein
MFYNLIKNHTPAFARIFVYFFKVFFCLLRVKEEIKNGVLKFNGVW